MNGNGRGAERIPLISVRGCLLVSIQTALDDQLVSRLRDDIAHEIRRTGFRALLMDVSGVDIMDSYLARSIRDIGLTARLMGADTVLCGIDPIMAMTLVEMDLDMQGVVTARTLDAALDMVDKRLEERTGTDRESLEALFGDVTTDGIEPVSSARTET